jgi:hypothetical protein
MLVPLTLLAVLIDPPEVIPYVPHSVVANVLELHVHSACPSGLTVEVHRYGYVLPRSAEVVVRVNGRRLVGVQASRLAADLSHADAVYRFHMSCDRDRRRAWLSIDIARPAAEGEVSYFSASLFFGDRGVLVYNRALPVPAQSFWQWQSTGGQRPTTH